MRTPFKWISGAFTFVLLGTIVVVPLLPKPEFSFAERTAMSDLVNQLNRNLPRRMGTIGQMDKVSFRKDTLTYHYSLYGDEDISQFYQDNYTDVREIFLYSVSIMNGQQNMGTLMAEFLNNKGLILSFAIQTPGGETFLWSYNGIELVEFINHVQASPTEALQAVLDTHIKLTNLSLPMALDDMGNLQSIPINSMAQSVLTGEILLHIYCEGDNIIFVIETAETEFTLEDAKNVAQSLVGIDAFASGLAEDADFREFMSLLAIAQADFTYRVRNKNATDSVDVRIPYSILKKYCSIPQLFQ